MGYTEQMAQDRAILIVSEIGIPSHDYESYTYTNGLVTTITYKRGGSGGTTVGTMTIAYDGNGNPTSRAVVLS